jgi:hypothetical protein
VLLAWREAIASDARRLPKLHRGLTRAAKAARRVRWDRELERRPGRRDVLAVETCRERPGFLANALRRLIARHCPAWRGWSLEVGLSGQRHEYTCLVTLGGPLVGGFHIPRTWYRDVYEQGRAVYRGNPVTRAGRDEWGFCDDPSRIEFVQPVWDEAQHPRLECITAVQ